MGGGPAVKGVTGVTAQQRPNHLTHPYWTRLIFPRATVPPARNS